MVVSSLRNTYKPTAMACSQLGRCQVSHKSFSSKGQLKWHASIRPSGGLKRIYARDDEYFDEGAAQVKRLVDRDRKELMKEQIQPKAEYDVDFERPAASSQNGGTSGAVSSSQTAYEEELSSLKNPMKKAYKSPPKKGAFGSSSKSPFGSDSPSATTVMQKDMWEDMEPVEEDEAPWWTQISFGQVAIVFSFVLIIGLMLATTWATVKLGGVHYNE